MFLALAWMACCGPPALAATPYSIALGPESEYSFRRILHDRHGNVYAAGTRLAAETQGRFALARIAPGGQVDWLRTYEAVLASSPVLGMDDKGDLLVGGEAAKAHSRIYYPLNPSRRADMTASQWWEDVPTRALGPHDGLPDARRR